MRNQRIAHLEAQVARRERPIAQTVARTSGGWNWISPETLASGSDAQAETALDLSGLVKGGSEVLIAIIVDYDENAGSTKEWFYLKFRAPNVPTELIGFYMLVDGSVDAGAGGQVTLPLDGSGLTYFTEVDRTGGGALDGQFDWSFQLLAWR